MQCYEKVKTTITIILLLGPEQTGLARARARWRQFNEIYLHRWSTLVEGDEQPYWPHW